MTTFGIYVSAVALIGISLVLLDHFYNRRKP